MRMSPEERFMKYVVEYDDGCWDWEGAKFRNGRGAFFFEGRAVIAYRWIYTLKKGTIPKGMDVHHKCKNVNCVRPKHLKLMKHDDHIRKYHNKNGAKVA